MQKRSYALLSFLLLLAATAIPAASQSFQFLRIGDVDGFGFGDGAGLLNFQGNPVNVDGMGVLGPAPPTADFMPDLNQDGLVQDFHGDDFDNRSVAEIAGTLISGSGFADEGTTGAEFTDVSLSNSYDTMYPPPNDFPDPPSTDRNDVHVEFRFFVATGDITQGQSVFLNVVFGDIGAIAGNMVVTFASAPTVTVPIDPIDPNVEDGLIRSAFVALDFADVFTAVSGGWSGHVDADIVTRPGTAGDPYYAIDYVELSTSPVTAVASSRLPGAGGSLVIAPTIFGDRTGFHYRLADGSRGVIDVFDVRGAHVRSFAVSGPTGAATWDGTDLRGKHVASGVYFVRLRSAGWSTTGRAVLTR